MTEASKLTKFNDSKENRSLFTVLMAIRASLGIGKMPFTWLSMVSHGQGADTILLHVRSNGRRTNLCNLGGLVSLTFGSIHTSVDKLAERRNHIPSAIGVRVSRVSPHKERC